VEKPIVEGWNGSYRRTSECVQRVGSTSYAERIGMASF
jgi:hypothetical protein